MSIQTTLRNSDFMRRCLITIEREHARGITPSVRRIVALTIFGGANSYYLDYYYAYGLVSKLIRIPREKRNKEIRNTPAQQRARMLTNAVEKVMNEQKTTLSNALSYVLINQSAPRFFMTIKYGMRLFNEHTKKYVSYKPLKTAI
jgi:hypothetical protein